MLSGESSDEIAELRDAMVPEDAENREHGMSLLPLTVAEVAEQGTTYTVAPTGRHTRRRRPASSSLPATASATRSLHRFPHSLSCDDSTFAFNGDDSCRDGTMGSSELGRQSDRKLTNREAARQCRQRKKTREEELKRERLSLMSKNTELQYEVQKLTKELTQLVEAMNDHICVMA